MKIEIPGVDVEKGLDLYDDDTEIYLTVLRSYASNTPVVLDKMRNVSAETLPNYAICIHGVKGTSANIGAEELRQAAMKLEAMAKAGDLSGILAQNDAFLKRADKLMENIQRWLRQHDAKP